MLLNKLSVQYYLSIFYTQRYRANDIVQRYHTNDIVQDNSTVYQHIIEW